MPMLRDVFGEKEESRNSRGLYRYCTVTVAKRTVVLADSASTRKYHQWPEYCVSVDSLPHLRVGVFAKRSRPQVLTCSPT